jgi:hypothetical protein
MRVVETKVYSFEELSATAKEVAIENNRDINTHFDWYEPIFDDFKETAEEQGFHVGNIYFSGFWSQGDGAMFEYVNDGDILLEQFIDTLDLSPMRKNWLRTQAIVSCKGVHRGHYYHENCCSHSVYFEPNFGWNENFSNWITSFADQFEEFVVDKYKSLCGELYRDLNKYHDELTSDEYVAQALIENDWEFTEDGNIF